MAGTTITNESKNVFTLIATAGTDTNTDATSPGTMADDDTVGTDAWTSPDNAKASDDSDAYVTLPPATTSHYLKATNFGFAIPSGATINGIKVEVEKADSSNDVKDSTVRIVKGGTIGSTDKANATAWPTVDAYTTYGGSTELWGESWTPADINGSTFGFVISGVSMSGGYAHIDHIRITVYYTTASIPATFANEGKGEDLTWATVKGTWADHKRSTWAKQRKIVTEESKNNLDITNESKN